MAELSQTWKVLLDSTDEAMALEVVRHLASRFGWVAATLAEVAGGEA